jgi:hypothetical protein
MNGIGEIALRDSHRREEFFELHLSGVYRNPVCRYAWHDIEMLLQLQIQPAGYHGFFLSS